MPHSASFSPSHASAPAPVSEAAAAREAGLRYVCDQSNGIRRQRAGRHFTYLNPHGRPIRDPDLLRRIRSLAIPPAWTHVWICLDPQGHVQATGRDARGRKQYRYHRRWREARDETKFGRMIAAGRLLPRLRQRVARDLRRPGLGREKVLATVVSLMDLAAIRVGNDEYALHNRSFGLTTLRDRHAQVKGGRIRLRFRGKSGKDHDVSIESPHLARIVKKCQDLPGQELFQWVDEDGGVHDVTSGDVNDYLRGIAGCEFTSKDFRTWSGTVLAARALRTLEPATTDRAARHGITQAVMEVARHLGNTPTVCRKCYVHPAVFESYRRGDLHTMIPSRLAQAEGGPRLRPVEAAVLRLLERARDKTAPETLGRRLRASLRHRRRRTH